MRVRLRRLGAALLVALLGILTVSALLVIALRWLDPPFSSFTAQDWIGGLVERRDRPWVHQDWVPWESISPAVPLAVVAAEDQRFPTHRPEQASNAQEPKHLGDLPETRRAEGPGGDAGHLTS